MTKSLNVQKENTWSWLDLLVLSAWLHGGLLYFVGTAIGLITGSMVFGNAVLAVYYIFLALLSFNQWKARLRVNDLFFAWVLVLVLVASYLLNFDARPFIEARWFSLLFSILPYYYVGVIMVKEKRTYDLLHKGSVVAILVNFLYVFVVLGTGREMQEDNLAISYSVLPHALMVIWYAFEKKKIIHVLLCVASFLFILSLGSRGPVLSCIVFIVLFFAFKSKGNPFHKFLFFVGLIAAIYFVMFSSGWEDFLIWLRDLIQNFNISTRVLDSVLEGAAEGSNEARMEIYQVMWEYIKKNPFIGYGIYGEWAMISYYTHQIVLELWCHYGVVIGTGVLMLGAAKVVKAYKSSLDDRSKMFILLMVAWGVVRCMYAGTYLSEYIFLLVGFSVGLLREEKSKREGNL